MNSDDEAAWWSFQYLINQNDSMLATKGLVCKSVVHLNGESDKIIRIAKMLGMCRQSVYSVIDELCKEEVLVKKTNGNKKTITFHPKIIERGEYLKEEFKNG